MIGPAPVAPGRLVKEFLVTSAGTLDAEFAADVMAARESISDEMRTTWPGA